MSSTSAFTSASHSPAKAGEPPSQPQSQPAATGQPPSHPKPLLSANTQRAGGMPKAVKKSSFKKSVGCYAPQASLLTMSIGIGLGLFEWWAHHSITSQRRRRLQAIAGHDGTPSVSSEGHWVICLWKRPWSRISESASSFSPKEPTSPTSTIWSKLRLEGCRSQRKLEQKGGLRSSCNWT